MKLLIPIHLLSGIFLMGAIFILIYSLIRGGLTTSIICIPMSALGILEFFKIELVVKTSKYYKQLSLIMLCCTTQISNRITNLDG